MRCPSVLGWLEIDRAAPARCTHPRGGAAPREVDYATIPTAVFTHPSVGAVGLTEAQARAQGLEVRIFRSEFRALKHTLSGNTERTLMKLVVDAATGRIISGPEIHARGVAEDDSVFDDVTPKIVAALKAAQWLD